ncbi:hypothetical protein FD05_GL001737 [Lentilactobacillus otakiensis DSM 19908 = JCM 15040]|uniref:Uncharacterized protein n=1 Tax=Lentilactobacillus otakiensis DSM 19908 = JCM 15040 TaxID=1423780 RepID=S4PQQ9_9LACO|nr:hypothetical protein FD05_GL001737 [Lentilactobacillus otakiensis DSM 19908 = JCM 15040]GAD17435.1 hypothetical protein LOT_1973 [Lentilactobacillus otakiensis DSM 19908 = JCM 15040]
MTGKRIDFKKSVKKGVLIPEFKGISQLFPVLEWLVYSFKWPESAGLSTFFLSNFEITKKLKQKLTLLSQPL